MPLVKCNECGHMVSDKAAFCPNCGNPSFLPIKVIPIHINAGSFIDVCLKEKQNSNETIIPLASDNSAKVETTKKYIVTCKYRYLATSDNPITHYHRSDWTYAIGKCEFCIPYNANKVNISFTGEYYTWEDSDSAGTGKAYRIIGKVDFL